MTTVAEPHGPPTSLKPVRWTGLAIIVRQSLLLVTLAVLARLVSPGDFGLMAMAVVVLGFAMLFRDLGVGSSVVQHRDLPEGYVSQQFWLVVTIGIALTFVIFIASEPLARMFHEPELELIIQVTAPIVMISSFGSIPQALLERRLAFGVVARCEIGAAATAVVGAVFVAVAGGGVWSLVTQAWITALVTSGLLFAAANWRPERTLSLGHLRSGAAFGSGVTAFNVANYLARNTDYFLIGRVLGAQQLGYYSVAYRLMMAPVQVITGAFNRVLFPVLSRAQDHEAELRRIYLDALGAVSFLALPVGFALAVTAHRLIPLLLGPGWEDSVAPLQLLALVGIAQTVGGTIGPIWLAKGAVREMAVYGIVASVAVVAAFVVGLQAGIVGVALAYLVVSWLLLIPSMWLATRHIGLGLAPVWGAVWRSGTIASIMAAAVLVVDNLLALESDLAALTLDLAVGVGVYLALSLVLNRPRLAGVVDLVDFDRSKAGAFVRRSRISPRRGSRT